MNETTWAERAALAARTAETITQDAAIAAQQAAEGGVPTAERKAAERTADALRAASARCGAAAREAERALEIMKSGRQLDLFNP